MKYSNLKQKPASAIISEESKNIEDKLAELRGFMKKSKQTRKNPLKISNHSDLMKSYKPVPKQTEVLVSTTAPESGPVFDFLSDCGLEKYSQVMAENGIDDLETLKEISEEHLVSMKIPLGHRLKMLKKIKEIELSIQQSDPEETSQRNELVPLNDLEELPPPQDTFEEYQETDLETMAVQTEEYPAPRNINLQTVFYTTVKTQKKSCWQCFELFTNGIQFNTKDFCSEECKGKYSEELTVECFCGMPVLKGRGVPFRKRWYCSEECADLDNDQIISIDPITGDPL